MIIASPASEIESLPPLLNKDRAAWAASVSPRQVDKLVSQGLFPPFVLVGNSRRWRAAELLAWSEAGCPPIADWQWPSSAVKK